MISNSSPLIFLSKIGKLILLKKLFNSIKIPESVKNEIIIEGKPDSLAIAESIKEGWIKIQNPKKELSFGVGKGENSAINLAIETKEPLIIDDALAVKIATSFNLEVLRTTSIIFLALKKKLLTKKEAIFLLNQLVKEGYYISPKYYSLLIEKLNDY